MWQRSAHRKKKRKDKADIGQNSPAAVRDNRSIFSSGLHWRGSAAAVVVVHMSSFWLLSNHKKEGFEFILPCLVKRDGDDTIRTCVEKITGSGKAGSISSILFEGDLAAVL